MATRCSMLFDFTTNPQDLTKASARSGGWSETVVTQSEVQADIVLNLRELMMYRAAMLPLYCAIVGFRLANVDIVNNNQIVYLGTSSGLANFPGRSGYSLNLPQDSLLLSLTATNGINTTRHPLRGLPDEVTLSGEYQPTPSFTRQLNGYVDYLTRGFFGWFGRDLSKPAVSVVAVTGAGVVTTSQPLAVAVGDYVKFHRCKAADGTNVTGSFQVTAVAGVTITLQNWTGKAVTKQNGLLRQDALAFLTFSLLAGARASSHKVGNSFARYRGRRSKRPA